MNWAFIHMMHFCHPSRSLAEGLIAAGENIVCQVPTRMVKAFVKQDCNVSPTPGIVGRYVDRTIARILDLDAMLFCHSIDVSAKHIEIYRKRGLRPCFYFFDPYPDKISGLAKEAMSEFDCVFAHGEQVCKELLAMGARKAVSLLPYVAGASTFSYKPQVERDVDIVCSFTAPYDGRGWDCTSRVELVKAFRSEFGDKFVHHGRPERWEPVGIDCKPLIQPHEMHALYARAKIVLNAHARHNCKHYCNHRFFEILSCGALQLCDRCNDLEEIVDGSGIAYYDSVADAVKQAKQLLADEERRARMADSGYCTARSRYSGAHAGRLLADTMRGINADASGS